MNTTRLPPDMRRLLDQSGLPWHIQTGTRHYILRVNGRAVTILPKGTTRDVMHSHRNAMATVRRAIREQQRGQR